jgi:hypothetical protein
MYDAVHPRYTIFEKCVLGVLYILELPVYLIRVLADKSRRRFDKLYLDNTNQ